MEVAVAEILTFGITVGLTVMETELEVAVAGLAQAALEVIIQYTCAPLERVVVEKLEPVPATTLFTNH